MAPSRDRLLHFGFKATVSDRGRELGGREGQCMPAQATGEEATRLMGLGRQARKLKCLLGWCVLFARRGEKRGPQCCVQLSCSPLSHRSASTRALAPAPQPLPDTNTQTYRHFPASPSRGGLACLGGQSGLRRRRRRRAPAAPGRTVAGCAREWGRGGPAPPPPRPPPPRAPPPPSPRSPEARAALPNEERRCWQVGSVFVLGWSWGWGESRASDEQSSPPLGPREVEEAPPESRGLPSPPTAPARRSSASSGCRNSWACPGPPSLHSARRSARPRPHPPAPWGGTWTEWPRAGLRCELGGG